jgi:hypothetical protein
MAGKTITHASDEKLRESNQHGSGDRSERFPNGRITNVDGHIGGVTFSLTGPPALTEAIVKYIRSLTRMSGGYY